MLPCYNYNIIILYVDKSSDSPESIGLNYDKLTYLEDIELEFAKMTNRIKETLISSHVNVSSLVEQLCTMSAVKNKNVPLFDGDIFEKVKSIDEFWKRLRMFWSIIDYDLLWFVIELSECKKAQEILKEFLSRIDPSVIEDVDLVLHCKEEHWDGSLKPVLRIKINAEKCSLDIIQKAKEIISEKFELKKYSLRFKGIKSGCVELLHHISKAMMLYFLQFKISSHMLAELTKFNIISLHIDDFKLEVPSEAIDITVSNHS